MSFAPIAIVGQACLLPGAATPQQLWRLIVEGRTVLSPCPTTRWGIDRRLMLAPSPGDTRDRSISDCGGYVEGFDSNFDPTGFGLSSEEIAGLDPLFQWLLHLGREVLRDARYGGDLQRAGAIIGNLSYPSASLSRFAEGTWLADGPPPFRGPEVIAELGLPAIDPRNRFMSGLPAHLLARALGLGAGAFALDAACASSLYAIKLACDALQEGRADLMIAGAVNCADDLFIHAGFTALGALSPTGRSRPFDADADGLVPAEGAGLVALRRLPDAELDGDRILGVIRGVGLSNDGRGRAFLVPSEEGQVRALRAAYREAGIAPADISMVECHATGTTVGDAVEIGTLAKVFGARPEELPIGSLKANLGHLITAAGLAGLLKVLGALREGVRPPTPGAVRLNPAFEGTPLRVLRAPEPWDGPGPRRAAINAFGFGGNNAHLIVEESPAPRSAVRRRAAPAALAIPAKPVVAIVSIGALVGDGASAADFAVALFTGRSRVAAAGARANEISLSLKGLRFPPKDLEATLPQQLMVLAAAGEAVARASPLPGERTGVFIGMQCDAEICRHGARWRVAGWSEILHAPEGWTANARDGFVPLLGASGVVGAMPNIVANRLSSQFDLGGPSLAVSAEELSGVRALEIARGALERGEIDAALVGAVDLSAEPVHLSAAAAVLRDRCREGGDAAVVLIVKRLSDAYRDGDRILAVLQDEPATGSPLAGDSRGWSEDDLRVGDGPGAVSLEPLFGHAHAAAGLLSVAAGALCCAHRARPASPGAGDVTFWTGAQARRVAITTRALGGQTSTVWLGEAPQDAPANATAGATADGSSAGGEGQSQLLAALAAMAYQPAPPVLTFAAHPPPPVLPQLPRAIEVVQLMAPAPPLPPVWFANGQRHAVTSSAPSELLPGSPAMALQAAGPLGVVFSRHVDHGHRVADIHRDFLAAQTGLQLQFLDTRQRAVEGFFAVIARDETSPVQAPPRAAPHRPVTRAPHDDGHPERRGVPDAGDARPPARSSDGPPPERPALSSSRTSRTFSRADLEVHSSGRISDIFGPTFATQGGHVLQVRMPEPPLLLADRVVGLDAEPASMGLGIVWTETDVAVDSWYLNRGFMPAGIMIEAGQADLFLISYLGIDAHNQGRRAYRLLGCELTYHGSLPARGDTLRYQIQIDRHASQGDIRLFFFHYDCTIGGQPALTVRQGQAGFFSREDLAGSTGVLWSPEEQAIRTEGRVDPPAVLRPRANFACHEIQAFSRGDLHGCFGAGFERGQTHVRTPSIQGGRMLLIDEIRALDPRGGPWGRGYLKAVTSIHANDWFFAGHFKNDPCMPGTLMFEGCLQAMSFYIAALGYTLDRDGWRFEPVPDEPYKLQCRGQVVPTSKELVCELFVEEVHAGPFPTIYADLLGTVDGLKAFHARRVGLRLVPDWPLSSRTDLLPREAAPSPRSGEMVAAAPPRAAAIVPMPVPAPAPAAAPTRGGFRFDHHSLIACAWGKPSEAFGDMYRIFDGVRRVARLPGPPYHFMSRVTDIAAEIGICKPGGSIEIEYAIPPQAWYFSENGAAVMPFPVLLEVVLQPCGWLASYVGSALLEPEDLSFRNLDGTGRVLAEVTPGASTLRTQTKLVSVSHSGGMILLSFEVRCWAGETLVYELDTGFGFFPKAALENQVGLPTTPEQRALHDAPSDFLVDLAARPAHFFDGAPALPGPMLLMIDRVTAFDPRGGRAGLGFLRAEKDVNPAEWFFKAHFFQDPVQPGSLGIEAMLQLLQFYLAHQGLGASLGRPRFESIACGRPMTWKYRGQVVPHNRLIAITLEVVEVGRDPAAPYAVADASLWVDGKRIYQATGLGVRIVDEAPSAPAAIFRTRRASPGETPGQFLPGVSNFWRDWFGATVPVVDDLHRGLIDRFVGQLRFEDHAASSAVLRRPVLLVGNHQTRIESTIFAIVASALLGTPLLTLANAENRRHWLDRLMRHTFDHPGLRDPQMTTYFDRQDSASLLGIIDRMANEMRLRGRSVMVHVEGTRSLSCRPPVRKMSGTFVEMAMSVDCPIVPVRFVGGLPAEQLSERTELPVGMGRQDIYLGRPLMPDELRGLGYRERTQRVMAAINVLGPSNEIEEPLAPQPAFEGAVRSWMVDTGATLGHATFFRILDNLVDPSPATRHLLEGARAGALHLPSSPEGLWLGELARRLFGEHGPAVIVDGRAHSPVIGPA